MLNKTSSVTVVTFQTSATATTNCVYNVKLQKLNQNKLISQLNPKNFKGHKLHCSCECVQQSCLNGSKKINWMLQDSFHQKVNGFSPRTSDGLENYTREFSSKHLEKQLWFSSRLSFMVISGCYHKWFGLVSGGIWCFSVWWITPEVSYCYAAAPVSLRRRSSEVKKGNNIIFL